MFLGILLRAARDIWNESFFLMIFNFFFAAVSIPGFLLVSYAARNREGVVAVLGLATLALWPMATFGLFSAAAEVVARRTLHVGTFFRGARKSLGLAYRWGLMNLAVLVLLMVNVSFYLDPRAPLYGTGYASFLGALFLLLTVLWFISQTFLLAAIPVLELVSLRQGWRALPPLAVKHPLQLLGLGLICSGLFVAGLAILPLGILLAYACVAVLACHAVADWSGNKPSRRTAATEAK